MTKNQTDLVTVIATDVKWLKKQIEENALNTQSQLNKIELHLSDINGGLGENNAQTAVNKNNIYRLWWFIGGVVSVLIPIMFKFFGVF